MNKISRGIREIFSAKDIVPKLVCLLLAAILWAIIHNTNISEVHYKIPVKYTNLPQSLVLSKPQIKYITVKLTGSEEDLKHVNIKDINASVKLDNPSIGIARKYPIELINNNIPENVDISLSADGLYLTVENNISKKVEVKPFILDNIKNGFVIGDVRVIPDTITITGPESTLKKIDTIKTSVIAVGKKTGRLVKEAGLETIPGVITDINSVKVVIPVIQAENLFKVTKTIITGNAHDDYKYELEQTSVNVYLQSENSSYKPSADDVEVFIDLTAADIEKNIKKEGKSFFKQVFPVNANLKNKSVRVISVMPDTIAVKITLKEGL